jgi:hypothetical protein
MIALVIFKPGRLSEAAVIIAEGEAPDQAGVVDA